MGRHRNSLSCLRVKHQNNNYFKQTGVIRLWPSLLSRIEVNGEKETDESQDCVKRHRWMTVSKSLRKLEMMNSEGNDYTLPERYVGEQVLMTRLKLSQMFQGRIVPDSKILELLFVFDMKFCLFNINRQNSLTLKRHSK